MSYATMDHAGWAEDNIRAAKSMRTGRKPRADARKGFAGAPDALNPFQRSVMDILGIVGGGIYNAPMSWDAIEWGQRYLAVPWRGDLATFDGKALTLLVMLCHEACIRVNISARTFRHVMLVFHPRRDDGCTMSRHPTLDEAAASFRSYVPQEVLDRLRSHAPLAAAPETRG